MDHELNKEEPHIRRLWAMDQDEIRAHFLRLDGEARHARFGGAASDAVVANYANHILQYDSVICGAFINGRLCAIGELRGLYHDWPLVAEAAFSVETEWQNAGIGDALLDHMIAIGRNRGVKTINMTCMMTNKRMKHLASKHHAFLEYSSGSVDATLKLRRPTLFSVIKEIAANAEAFTNAVLSWPSQQLKARTR